MSRPRPVDACSHPDETIEVLPVDSPVAAAQAALLGSASAETVILDKEIRVHG